MCMRMHAQMGKVFHVTYFCCIVYVHVQVHCIYPVHVQCTCVHNMCIHFVHVYIYIHIYMYVYTCTCMCINYMCTLYMCM